ATGFKPVSDRGRMEPSRFSLPAPQDRSMGIIKAALGNVYAVIVLALLILTLGLTAVAALPADILPAFNTPAVQILTFYAGMPAASVEKTITNRIERWVNQAPGVRRMESR